MKRRRLLQTVGAVGITATAGCLDGVREHFLGEVRTNAPVEVFNAGGYPFDVTIEAREAGTGRETYDVNINLIPDERAIPQNIARNEQQFSVTRYGVDRGSGGATEDLVETGVITEDTQLVLIHLHDAEIDLQIIESEREAETEREELEEEANVTTEDAEENESSPTDDT